MGSDRDMASGAYEYGVTLPAERYRRIFTGSGFAKRG